MSLTNAQLRTFAVQRHARLVAAIRADNLNAKDERILAADQALAADLDTITRQETMDAILRPSTLSLEPTTDTPYHNGRTLLDARTVY